MYVNTFTINAFSRCISVDAIRNKYASYTNKYYLIQINLIQLIQNIIHLNPYINKSTDFLNDNFKLDRSPYVLICRGRCLHYLGVRKVKCIVLLERLLVEGDEGHCGCQSKGTVQLLICEQMQMVIFHILLFF